MKFLADGSFISKLRPSIAYPETRRSSELDVLVQSVFETHFPVLSAIALHEYDLSRFSTAAYYYPMLFDRLGSRFRDKTVIEVGSGIGMKSLPWSTFFASYIGVEIDPRAVAAADDIRQRVGNSQLRYICANAADVLANPAHFGIHDPVEGLILYAVLEHLTPRERQPIFEMAREVYARGGFVLVAETPNRLVPFDSHSSRLAFFQTLPDELALRYASRSPRATYADAVARAGNPELELYRQGRSLSFHDFELDFPAASCEAPPLTSTGWDTALLNLEPPKDYEVVLWRTMAGLGVTVDPLFARAWIEFIACRSTDTATDVSRSSLAVQDGLQTISAAEVSGAATLSLSFSAKSVSGSFVVEDEAGHAMRVVEVQDVVTARLATWHDVATIDVDVSNCVGALRIRPCDASSRVWVYLALLRRHRTLGSV